MSESKIDPTKPTGFPGDANYDPGQSAEVDADLADALDHGTAKGWQPKVGDQAGGTVIDIDESDAGGFGEYPIVTIVQSTGEAVSLHCFHTTLKRKVSRLIATGRLVEGCRVAIRYNGQVDRPGQQSYHDYNFVVRPPATA